MNPARPAGRLARILAAALACAAPPALAATPRPRPPGWNKLPPLPAGPRPALGFPPGWNKFAPLPAHVHPLATTAIPGWQLTLMAVTVVLLAATLVAIAYPGPGRTAAGERTHRLRDDRIPRHADRQGQPAALARPAPDAETTKPVPGLRKGITVCGIQRIRRPGRDRFAGRFIQDVAAARARRQARPEPPPRRRCPGGA